MLLRRYISDWCISVCLCSSFSPVLKLVQTNRHTDYARGDSYWCTLLSVHLVAGLGKAALWKTKIEQNAAALFRRRSADMQSLVYGTSAADTPRGKHAQQVSSWSSPACKALQLTLDKPLNLKFKCAAVAAALGLQLSSHSLAHEFPVQLGFAQSCGHMGNQPLLTQCLALLWSQHQSKTQLSLKLLWHAFAAESYQGTGVGFLC